MKLSWRLSFGCGVIVFFVFLGLTARADERTNEIPKNQQAIAEVVSGQQTTANAAWWGFNPDDATEALQSAIDSKAKTVVVPFVGQPWIIRPIVLRSGLELIFEPGVLVLAKRGEFRGGGDSLFRAVDMTGITVRGYGATLRMRKMDYRSPPYAKAEWRMGLSFTGCKRVRVEGLRIESTGGDGIYLGFSGQIHQCEDVVIRDCICHDNYRQGISVISAVNLLIENCVLSGTEGTAPEAGIDLEPDTPEDRLVHCVIRNCLFQDNSGNAILVYLKPLTGRSEPVSIRFENCHARLGKPGTPPAELATGAKQGWSGIAIGKVRDGGPKGVIEFVRCTTENTGREGARIYDKSAEGALVRFDHCRWARAWVTRHQDYGGPRAPILIQARDAEFCRAPGGIEFVDCSVFDQIDGATVRFEDETGQLALRQVSGMITVQNPRGARMVLGSNPTHVNLRLVPMTAKP